MQPARIKLHGSTQTTPSRDLTLGGMQLATLILVRAGRSWLNSLHFFGSQVLDATESGTKHCGIDNCVVWVKTRF